MLQSLTERVAELEKGMTAILDSRKAEMDDTAKLKEQMEASDELLVVNKDMLAGVIRVLGKELGIDRETLHTAFEEAKAVRLALVAKDGGSYCKASGIDGAEYIDSKEACRVLGWKSISTTMLRKAGIRYQQPLGKHRKITAHKGDIENYVRNRRDGRK